MDPKRLIVAVVTLLPIALFASGLPAQRQRPGGGPAPDVIYYNARVVTVDEQFSCAQAIAITGDKFSAVGTNESTRRLAGPNTRQIDLRGMTRDPRARRQPPAQRRRRTRRRSLAHPHHR